MHFKFFEWPKKKKFLLNSNYFLDTWRIMIVSAVLEVLSRIQINRRVLKIILITIVREFCRLKLWVTFQNLSTVTLFSASVMNTLSRLLRIAIHQLMHHLGRRIIPKGIQSLNINFYSCGGELSHTAILCDSEKGIGAHNPFPAVASSRCTLLSGCFLWCRLLMSWSL